MNDVCTQARPESKSDPIRFDIAANSAFKVDIPVFPLKEGYFPLKIDAISSEGSDSVVKELYVVVSRHFGISIHFERVFSLRVFANRAENILISRLKSPRLFLIHLAPLRILIS